MAAYIKFDGVDGEAQDKDHKGWSDIMSFSQGLHQPGGGSTGATRRRGDVILDPDGVLASPGRGRLVPRGPIASLHDAGSRPSK